MSVAEDLSAPAPLDAPPRRVLHPWLPWLAFGLVVGGLAPEAVGFASGIAWSPQRWWWVVGLPLLGVVPVLMRRTPWAARWLVFACACLLGGALCDGWGRRPPSEEPRLLALTGTVAAVKWGGVSQGFLLLPDGVEAPTSYAPPRRVFVRASDAYGLLSGDRVVVRGLWQRGERGDELKAVEVERLEMRADGPRGWAWNALGRLGAHRELGETLILGVGDPPEKAAFRQSGLLHILTWKHEYSTLSQTHG